MIKLAIPFQDMDQKGFFIVFNLGRHSALSQFARIMSYTGDGYLYALIAVAIYFLDPINGVAFVWTGLLAFMIELPLYLLLKNLIRRPRPSRSINNFKSRHNAYDEFSCPSGHTAAAFLYATLLSFYYPQLYVVFFLVAGLIGLSRVLLGVHFPSDIAAGILLGCFSALVVVL